MPTGRAATKAAAASVGGGRGNRHWREEATEGTAVGSTGVRRVPVLQEVGTGAGEDAARERGRMVRGRGPGGRHVGAAEAGERVRGGGVSTFAPQWAERVLDAGGPVPPR